MKKIVALTSVVIFLFACNSSNDPSKKITRQDKTSSLEPFADSLVRLDKYDQENIEKAARYFQQLVPADSSLADSAAVMLLNQVRQITDSLNQKFYKDTADYFNLAYDNGSPLSDKEKAFQQQLANHHLNLQGDGEGGALIVLNYDWLNSILQQKTSAAVDNYLSLLGAEEKHPAVLDAGIAIEMKDLVDRLISSENLLTQTLPHTFAEDANRLNKLYTNLLLVGSDNSPSLDYNYLTIMPDFTEAYLYLLTTYPSSKAAQKVTGWIAIVKAKDKKKIEEMRASANE